MKVIPVVNAKTFEELRAGLLRVKEFAQWAHIDVSDTSFTNYTNWGNAKELDLIPDDAPKIELHLMTALDRNSIRKWLKPPIARVIVHAEGVADIEAVIKVIKKEKREVGIALKRETPASTIEKLIPFIDQVLVLAVIPGPAGQAFDLAMLEKIKELRAMNADIHIEIDGGVNLEIAKQVKEAGADVLAVASYIWKSPDPKKAYKDLSNI